MTNTKRSFVCGTCNGIVSIPKRKRKITLDQVSKVHEATCPGRLHRRNKENSQ